MLIKEMGQLDRRWIQNIKGFTKCLKYQSILLFESSYNGKLNLAFHGKSSSSKLNPGTVHIVSSKLQFSSFLRRDLLLASETFRHQDSALCR